jgi:hypothetical protein
VTSTAPPGTVEDPAAAPPRTAQMNDLTAAIGAYARACLTAVRGERDWFRRAIRQLEAAGEQIVQTEQPGKAGDPWLVLNWRTGQTLAHITGGQDAYDEAWQDGWTDVSWIGRWIDDLATNGCSPLDWPAALPPPPELAELAAAPPQINLPGLPPSLRATLEQAIEFWSVAASVTEGRAAEVARLTGWTEDQVLACTASYLTMTGDRYMRIGDTGGQADG